MILGAGRQVCGVPAACEPGAEPCCSCYTALATGCKESFIFLLAGYTAMFRTRDTLTTIKINIGSGKVKDHSWNGDSQDRKFLPRCSGGLQVSVTPGVAEPSLDPSGSAVVREQGWVPGWYSGHGRRSGEVPVAPSTQGTGAIHQVYLCDGECAKGEKPRQYFLFP